jgi:crotonobetainyl-CoA:carnitine CoA-transferase CaiB-like acyl-CoA transferase
MPGDDAVIERLNRHRVPVAPVLSAEEAINHPHLRERGTVRRVHDKIFGEYDLPGFPIKFSAFKALDLEAPLMGEHNQEILTRYLSYTPERIRALERDKVLFSARI